ncbi:hypothetical protein HOF40_01355 [Candidatus Parcubacteria bacterium]|jgi:signal transduction histidine kinase|nr:hypothetical protein [Candidatus Parcubacteria bacterium]
MFILDIYTILPLTCAIFVSVFGFFVLSKDPKSRINQLMFGFNMAMFFWMFGTFMMFGVRGVDIDRSIFWDRFVYIGVVFMPSLMHHFSLIFTNKKNKQRKLLIANYTLSFVFLLVSRTPYFMEDLFVYSWGVHAKARIMHHVFLGYFFLGTGIFFYNMYGFFRKAKEKIVRIQTRYTFLAFAIVIFIGGSAYLHAYGVDTRFPFAYFSGIIFPVVLFYAVTRHHLLGARVVGAEVLAGIANFVLISEIFLAKSMGELLVRIFFALVIGLISVLFIMAVRKEIRRREEVTRLAHSLEKANLRLQELDHQKTEFLSIASHQLRTPLSILKGYIELIEDGAYGKAPKKMRNILHDMDESNERLVKLVDEFLDISRIEQGRTKFVFDKNNFNDLISSVVSELVEKADEKKMKILWRPSKTIGIASIFDEDKIRHVVFNYIDNAIKYSKKGTIKVSIEKEDEGITVRVKDNGLGFNKEDEVSFFQKFYRGKNVQGTNVNGTGLGIYVCRKFIERHKGHVWANSKGIGKGSEFGFWIPANLSKGKTE